MTLQRIAPLLIVSDIVRSRAFYVDGLGFSALRTWEPDGHLAWCWLQRDGAALMLQQFCEGEDPPASAWGKGVTLYIICDDADAIHAELRARDIEATNPETAFYGMRQTFVRDPDGYELCFESTVEKG